jgi:transcriptional regulator with XRE-family HTH domain
MARKAESKTAIGARLLRLMEETGKSVGQTAADIGLPKQTFAALVNGTTTQPRATAVQRIAEHFGVTTDWLLTGAGEPVAVTTRDARSHAVPEPEYSEWLALVGRLGLSDADATAMRELPLAVWRAVESLPFVAPRDPVASVQWMSIGEYAAHRQQLDAAARQAVRAWLTIFQGWVDHWGVDGVRTLLEQDRVRAEVRRGFSSPLYDPNPSPRRRSVRRPIGEKYHDAVRYEREAFDGYVQPSGAAQAAAIARRQAGPKKRPGPGRPRKRAAD